ncbi:MAG: dephospho-CoA kinase [Candidatus Sericytochromatia bacterium]
MILMCLTGSIATGKTTVSDFMKEKGCILIDTDLVVHDMYNFKGEASEKIKEEFGENCINLDGSVNREKLGSIVFSDKSKLEKLNEIIHPLVRKEVFRQRDYWKKYEEKNKLNLLVIYVIPLFFETGGNYPVDYITVSFCSEETQLERLIKRNKYTKEEAIKRINSQIPIKEKVNKADFLVDTNGSIESIKEQVSNLLSKLHWNPYYEKV